MYVAFVDLLGFSFAVERLSDDEADSFADLVDQTISLGSGPPLSYSLANTSVRQLYDMYTEFQRLCDNATLQLSKYCSHSRFSKAMASEAQSPETATLETATYRTIVFSDSIFLASTALEPVLHAAGELVADLLLKGVPSRGGIAKGHFHNFEWNLRAGQAESFRACAPFLGSGVIRAYRAESKGPRGIRILIDDSCTEDVRSLDNCALINLPPDDVSTHWSHEVNLGLFGLLGPAGIGVLKEKTEKLAENVSGDIRARHYDPTIQALSRMALIDYRSEERADSRHHNWLDDE
jgi:hypothetical protein